MSIETKICGITNMEDASAVADVKADYIGFIFYDKSPRYIEPVTARLILDSLLAPPKAVGVFVNEDPKHVALIANSVGLHAVQLHGDEKPEDYRDLKVPIWRAVRIENGTVTPNPADWDAERYLVDASVEGAYGGTGETADWAAAALLAKEKTVMLAGGLDPDNVACAIETVRPAGVDVSSGVETEPGKKNHSWIKRFVEAVRLAEKG